MKTEPSAFNCTCLGDLHSRLMLEGTVGRALNAFDITINIRTHTDELLVITLGHVRSPVNLNVSPSYFAGGFKEIVREGDEVKVQVATKAGKQTKVALLIGGTTIMLGRHDVFQNHFCRPEPKVLETFTANSGKIFSVLVAQAQANRFGCLLEPDVTTKGLLDTFLDQLIQDKKVLDYYKFKDRISKGLLELCGKGPGFTPAGDDFIAGYLAMFNWLCGSLKLGQAILPGSEFSLQTTWTSFKLMEYGARNLLDDQAQGMINSVAHNDTHAYIEFIELISKRGHTSGLDFATGMTLALYSVADRLDGTTAIESVSRLR